jgi:SAM-dependent methyltransferase
MPETETGAVAEQLEAAWTQRVLANREQAERLRESQLPDFYAPVTAQFVADPRRTDEPALDVLRASARPDHVWLDIGAGAGRYALPLALAIREVIAVEPSPGMRQALKAGISEHGLDNIRIVAGTWPDALDQLATLPAADVALIAHVAYDIEPIGPFLDAREAAAGERCIAVLTDRSPASVADPLWPLIHGEERVPLPALPELLALLHARDRKTEVIRVERPARSFESVTALAAFLRRQLFIAEGGDKDRELERRLPELAEARDGVWSLVTPSAGWLGIVTWSPPGA